MRFVYLLVILAGIGGVLALDRHFATGVAGRRLGRALVLTLPCFLAFDVAGAARGWFASDPGLNTLVVSPGVPLEEPLLLGLLTLVSVALWRGAARVLR